ncbi:hypothetical protein KXS13_19095, partial [Yokenella regensburgei]|uniref:hypothetical protein n=1 Tax=Yokenella regensburgei TaxID=158877 RepID=UPI003F15C4FC
EGGFTGRFPPPVPDKPEGLSVVNREAAIFLAGSPGRQGGGGEPPWHVHGVWCDRKARNIK